MKYGDSFFFIQIHSLLRYTVFKCYQTLIQKQFRFLLSFFFILVQQESFNIIDIHVGARLSDPRDREKNRRVSVPRKAKVRPNSLPNSDKT